MHLSDEVFERCAERWPRLTVDRAGFAAHVQACCEQGSVHCNDRALEDLYLAYACGQGDGPAVEVFERDLLGQVHRAIQRIDSRPDFVDEARQRLRERLLVGDEPKINTYRGRGSLLAWVCVAAIRTALNLRRQDSRAPAVDAWAGIIAEPDTLDVELEVFKARHRAAFSAALRTACNDLSARDRSVLKMVVLDGVSVSELARRYGVHRSNASRWVARARDALRQATRTRLKDAQGLGNAEADLVLRLVHSQLSVSFSDLVDAR